MVIKDNAVKKLKNEMRVLVDGRGAEGTVYRFHNLAVKIFKRPIFKHLEDGFDVLCNTSTKSFVLIKDKIYENDVMIGYTMDYIDDDFKFLDDIDMKNLISDFKMIKGDLGVFLESNIYLVDVHKKNILYDGHVHIIDTDPYLPLSIYTELLEDGESISDRKLDIEKNNLKHINTGIASFLAYRLSSNFSEVEKEKFGRGLVSKMEELGNHSIYIGDYIEHDAVKCKTLGEYVNQRLYSSR